jgi:hypothetical protein
MSAKFSLLFVLNNDLFVIFYLVLSNKNVRHMRPIYFYKVAMMCIFYLVVSCNSKDISKSKSEFDDYNELASKQESRLSPDRKQQRGKWLSQMKQTETYKTLVTNKIVSTDYLPVLNAISDAIRNTYTENGQTLFGISDSAAGLLEKSHNRADKMNFVIPAAAMSISENGGMPEEIVAVFERYKSQYNYFGQEGDMVVSSSGKQEKIAETYNLSFAFALFDPAGSKALDAIVESVNSGISSWSPDKLGYVNAFMASRSDYIKHLKEYYPSSKYLVDVDFELTSEELYIAYQQNEVAADEKYKGKKLAISGEIENIGKDIMDNPYVSFKVDVLENVTCYFSKDNTNALSNLKKGQVVTLTGECRGITLQNVVIKECQIIP